MTEAERRFERKRRTIGLFLGPLVGLAFWALPFPSLTPEAHSLAWILSVVVVFWVTEAIPIPVTALIGPLLCILSGVGPAREVLALFAHPIIFLFLGSFFIAQAMIVHGLDRRLALGILAHPWIGSSPGRLLFSFGAITGFISMWISNTASTAMMFPIALGILGAVDDVSRKGVSGPPGPGFVRFRTGLMLMVAYSASVGGIGTIIGTPPNLIAVGLIREQIGYEFSFLGWMALGIPLMLVMYGFLFFIMYGLHRPTGVSLEGAAAYIKNERAKLGGWTPGQRNAAAAFLLAVFLWFTPGVIALFSGTDSEVYQWFAVHLPSSVVALLAAMLLFFLPTDWEKREFTLTWEEAVKIDWGTILLFGGGLSLGTLMFKTGLAGVMGHSLMTLLSLESVWTITALAIFLGIIISELTSNTASANMIIPVVISIALAAGVNPLPPALGACLGASYGFMLPISTPPNAIVYGSGFIPITRMIRAGFVFDIVGLIVIWVGLRILCPLLGFV